MFKLTSNFSEQATFDKMLMMTSALI